VSGVTDRMLAAWPVVRYLEAIGVLGIVDESVLFSGKKT
jgi:hypothetical protein